jgi:membrane associated rhomboid family serine protease
MLPLKDTIPSRSFPIVNWILIALNVLAFMGELSADARGQAQELIYNFGVIPARFLEFHDPREFATLFTSMFLHGGWFHLFSNMWALYIFGDNVEDRMGPVPYLIFYLLCGLAAGMTHIYFNRNSTMPSLGASGAIAGVLGAYLLLFPHARVIALIPIFIFPFFFEVPALVYLGFWFLSQLLNGTLEIVHTVYSPDVRQAGGIAWWAHAGGFVAGLLLVWPFTAPRSKVRRRFADEYQPW